MPPTIVETDLKEILGSIQKDLKDIRENLSDLKDQSDPNGRKAIRTNQPSR